MVPLADRPGDIRAGHPPRDGLVSRQGRVPAPGRPPRRLPRPSDQRADVLCPCGLLPFRRADDQGSPGTCHVLPGASLVHLVPQLAAGLLGPQKTAARILYVFDSVWLVFTIISNLGSEWTGWAALLLHPLLAVPFFALAWFSRRRPRVTGILLLAVSVFFFQFFGWFRSGVLGLVTESVTLILFLGPLLASVVALLGAGTKSECPEEAEEELMTGNRSNGECEILSVLQRSSMSGLRSACSFDALTDQGDPAAIPPRCHRFEASQGISPTLAVASLRHQPP